MMKLPQGTISREARRPGPVAGAAAATLLLFSAGCGTLTSIFHKPPPIEKRLAESGLTLDSLQTEALRFADDYVESVSHAADEAAKTIGTRQGEVAALKWKIDQATAAYADATGENPVWNVLDLTVLATVSLMVVEDARSHGEFGDAVVPLIRTHVALEKSAWTLAGTLLSPEQAEELRNLIVEWRKQNPSERSVTGARFREFAVDLGKVQGAKGKPTSIFSMLYLDPFAGLSPTTAAIQQSRELAERVVAYAERAPNLMRWQAELLALEVQEQPAPQQLLADTTRVSLSIESISKTVEGLPELVNTQREAAIAQLFSGVAAEREAILADLEAKTATVETLLGQLRETMNAGGAMGTSLTETIRSLDAFVHYVSPPTDPNAPPKPAGKPFDPLDFGKAASDVGGMARDLNTLLRSANETAPAIAKIGQKTGEDLKGVIDHAFWRGLILIVVFLAGLIPVRLAYRAIERRFAKPPASSS